MTALFNRITAIWALMCGRDFVLSTLHKSKGKYVVTLKDGIKVPTYEVAYKFIDATTRHFDEIKAQIQREETAD